MLLGLGLLLWLLWRVLSKGLLSVLRISPVTFHVFWAWAFVAGSALSGLRMLFDPRNAAMHGLLVIAGFAGAIVETFVIDAMLAVSYELPPAKVIR